jgi:hypothetical protein
MIGAKSVGWGFRKSFKVAPGLRVNVSKRGTGVSVGPRGFKVSANTSGRRGVFLSMLGLFFRKRL